MNALDSALTVVLIVSGIGYEANPLAVIGVNNFLSVKLFLAILVAILFGRNQGIMRALCFGMGLVVIWNLSLLVGSILR